MSLILKYDLGNPHRLPVGYTPLAYIESSGTLYIDPNSTFSSTSIRSFKLIFLDTIGNWVYGTNSSGTNSSGPKEVLIGVRSYLGGGFDTPNLWKLNELYDVQISTITGAMYMGVNGETVRTSTGLANGFKEWLFADGKSDNTINVCRKWRLYNYKIWDNNILVKNFIPAKNLSGVVGLFDCVSQTFFTNSGTGAFIAGPEIVVLPYEYLLVEYIENVGNSYINTGLTVTSDNGNSYAFESMFTPTTLSPWSGYSYSTIAGVDGNTQVAYTLSGAPSIGNATGSTIMFTANTRTKVSITFATSAQTYYVNGASTGLSRAINTTSQILLFCGSNGYFARGRMEYAKFGAARNFVPCYRKSDMKPGMYDTVNGVFYTNTGTGEFILGPSVINCYTWEPNAGSGTLLGFYTNLSGIYDSSKGWVADFSTSSVEMPGLLTLLGTSTNFSFAVWFKRSSGGGWNTIWGCSGFELEGSRSGVATNQIVAYSWGQSGSGGIDYTLNEWHHLVMTRNTSESKFYLDGELKYTGSAGSIPNTALFLGALRQHGSQSYLGQMTNMMLFNTVLTEAQVKELYGK